MTDKQYLIRSQPIRVEVPYSEAAMHTRIAGTVAQVTLREYWDVMVDARNPNTGEYLGRFTPGEVGIFRDSKGDLYGYPVSDES